MKEGYLQSKISELSEQINKMNVDLSNLRLQLQQISKGVGDSHILLDKLNDVREFKKQLTDELSSQNEQRLYEIKNSFSEDIGDLVNQIVDKKFDHIEEIVNRVSCATKNMTDVQEFMHNSYSQVNSILAYNHFLALALMHKNILTPEEVNRFHRRAWNEVKKLLNGGDSKITTYVRVKNGVYEGSD